MKPPRKPARRSPLESQIQTEIMRVFGVVPAIRLWRSNTGAAKMPSGRVVRFGFPGLADISGFIAPTGRALYIEVKSKTGRQTDDQKRFQTICERFGALYVLARSTSDVRDALLAAGVALDAGVYYRPFGAL